MSLIFILFLFVIIVTAVIGFIYYQQEEKPNEVDRLYEEATATLNQMKRLNPEQSYTIILDKADIKVKTANIKKDDALFDLALTEFTVATEMEPNDVYGYILWANALAGYNIKEEKIKLYRNEALAKVDKIEELALSENNAQTYLILVEILTNIIFNCQEEEETKEWQAQLNGRIIGYCEKVLSIDANNAHAYEYWADALMRLFYNNDSNDSGLIHTAIEKYELSEKSNTQNTSLYQGWANAILNLYLIDKDESLIDKFIDKYEAAINLNDRDSELHFTYAKEVGHAADYCINNDKAEELYKLAIKHYDLAYRLDKDNFPVFLYWGDTLAKYAELKQDPALFYEAAKKYKIITQHDSIINNSYSTLFIMYAKNLFSAAKLDGSLKKKRKEIEAILLEHYDSLPGLAGLLLARLEALTGNEEEAYTWLDKSLAVDSYWSDPSDLEDIDEFHSLRQTYRFKELVKKHFNDK